jgi:hypothetical protein
MQADFKSACISALKKPIHWQQYCNVQEDAELKKQL